MMIDILVVLAMAWAIFKGFRNGLIIAVFSILGFIIGLAAALKLSTAVASRFGGEENKWMPFLAFLLVFIAVAFLVSMGARLFQNTVEWAMLGWVNRIGGVLFYAILYTLILSVILFYAIPLNLFGKEAEHQSVFYPYIKPIGPFVMDGLGKLIPAFKNMFGELQDFFGEMQDKI